MKSAGVTVLLCAVGLSLTGCGVSMRSYLEKETPDQEVAVRQDLTMPPDLRLPPPGTTAPAPDPGAAAAAPVAKQASLTSPPSTAPVYNAPKTTAAPAKPATTPAEPAQNPNSPDAVYINAGISVTNPDGTRKTQQQLNQELQAYYIAQKKAKNPNYGSVFNMGNIFKDE